MKLIHAIILLSFFLVVSCGLSEGSVYFPKYHYTALYKSIGGEVVYLQWGNKLIDLKNQLVVTNSANKTLNYLKVQDKITGTIGYVDADSVIKNPVMKGVIITPTIVYNTPSFSSTGKQAVNPPILLYVVELKDGDWARIEPYNASAVYNLSNTIDESSRIYNNKWLSIKDISTNQMTVEVTVALQLAIKTYNEAKKLIENNPNNEKILKDSDTSIKTEVEALKKVVEIYPKADQAILDMVQDFYNLAGPANPTNTGTESSGSTSQSSSESKDEL